MKHITFEERMKMINEVENKIKQQQERKHHYNVRYKLIGVARKLMSKHSAYIGEKVRQETFYSNVELKRDDIREKLVNQYAEILGLKITISKIEKTK